MRVRWTFAAKRDLVELHDYYSERPDLARRAARAIVAAVKLLKTSPGLGRPGRVPGTRELVVPRAPFIIPYTVVGQEVHLLRLLHTARPWPEKLQ